jgi:hypothetical protein
MNNKQKNRGAVTPAVDEIFYPIYFVLLKAKSHSPKNRRFSPGVGDD